MRILKTQNTQNSTSDLTYCVHSFRLTYKWAAWSTIEYNYKFLHYTKWTGMNIDQLINYNTSKLLHYGKIVILVFAKDW